MTTPTPLLDDRVAFLAPFVDAGVLAHADVHVAQTIARLLPDTAPEVLLAAALAVRATRLNHVCVVLDQLPQAIVLDDTADPSALSELPWPRLSTWRAELGHSDAVATVTGDPSPNAGVVDGTIRPLVFDGTRVYLERYWRYEQRVGDDLVARAASGRGPGNEPVDPDPDLLDRLFPAQPGQVDLQRRAAEVALSGRLAVIAGGPGTGKTHTVARLLAAAHHLARSQGCALKVALAAPTGKAAARMTEAVHHAIEEAPIDDEIAEQLRGVSASTIHRLIGTEGSGVRHDRANPIPADLVVIDEASMVSLPLMARLIDAVHPEARLVLVGDPYQLASIEAGAVLGDVVGEAASGGTGPLAGNVVVLEQVHRFDARSNIAALAEAIRRGDVDGTISLLDSGGDDVEWIRPDDTAALARLEREVLDNAIAVVRAATEGNAAAGLTLANDLKVLAATRRGPLGTHDWRERIEGALTRCELRPGLGVRVSDRWYIGRPVIVTRNDPLHQLVNGDTGLVLTSDSGRRVVAFRDPAGTQAVRMLPTSQLAAVETWWSMTIHKSQGSEYRHAVISLPHARSPILTRELLYTAVTRAKKRVTLVGAEDAIRAAVSRRVARATGLAARLWGADR
jgi:exodeoxyribonuclease V alpha subunit